MKVIGGDFGENKSAMVRKTFFLGRFKDILIHGSTRKTFGQNVPLPRPEQTCSSRRAGH